MERRENRFNIDFFEFSFLVEATIPPTPIARSMFWSDVINKYYHVLTEDEREKLFDWINRHGAMKQGIENNDEDCLLFNARFDKDNQYKVTTKYDGVVDTVNCFKWKDRYHTSIKKSLLEEYIIDIKPYVKAKDKLTAFVDRLRKININVKLAGNYPWIYIDEINGKRVVEKFEGNHGFTVAFLPAMVGKELHFTNITEIFKLLRKYK